MQKTFSPPATTAQLPRGYVAWPQQVLDALQAEQQRKGMKFADDYVQRHLERATLRYYYPDLHVAYKPVAGGIEVLAVGWPDLTGYMQDASVKVVQA
jgi:hypothetical protein